MSDGTLIAIAVLILNLVVRFSIGHEHSKTQFARTAISAPIDVTFLGVAFGAAAVSTSAEVGLAQEAKLLLVIFIILIAVSIAVSRLCVLATSKIIINESYTQFNMHGFGYFMSAAMLSIFVFYISLNSLNNPNFLYQIRQAIEGSL